MYACIHTFEIGKEKSLELQLRVLNMYMTLKNLFRLTLIDAFLRRLGDENS